MPAVVEVECCDKTFSFMDFFKHLHTDHDIKITAIVDHDKEWVLKEE